MVKYQVGMCGLFPRILGRAVLASVVFACPEEGGRGPCPDRLLRDSGQDAPGLLVAWRVASKDGGVGLEGKLGPSLAEWAGTEATWQQGPGVGAGRVTGCLYLQGAFSQNNAHDYFWINR